MDKTVFISQDKEYMKSLKDAIYSSPYLNDDEVEEYYIRIRNNIKTNDLQTHISLFSQFQDKGTIYMGHGSFTPQLIFITRNPTELNEKVFYLLKSISSALNISNYYSTSLSRFSNCSPDSDSIMMELLIYQLKYLNPSVIISFDIDIDTSLLNKEIEFIKTLSLDNLPNDEDLLKKLKNKIWKDIKHICSL